MTNLEAEPYPAHLLSFLAGGGETGKIIREYDWSSTPLGPAEHWPQSLKTALRIMLTSRQPIWIGWGEELTYLYNDAYRSIIGGKHPWAIGRPTREVWSEIWTDIGPLLDTAMGGVEGTYVEEQLLIMERNGYPEETYYTFSYSPIPADDGLPGGIICANTDDTQRVIGKRQVTLLRQLSANTVDAYTWQDVCERSMAALANNPHDLTFALLYLRERAGSPLTLVGQMGLPDGHEAAPATLPADHDEVWPAASVLADATPRVVEQTSQRFGQPLSTGAWQRLSDHAAVVAVPAKRENERDGVLIVGLNPYRLFGENYQEFLALAAGQIADALASADAYERERRRVQALDELHRAKTTFFSNVSHEFRTPLTLMLGPLEDVLGDTLPAEQARKQVELAHRNGTRLLRLVNSLLDFSRIEAGRVRAVYRATDIATFSAELASNFRAAIEKAGLTLELHCEPLPCPAYIDHEMWEKILLNLLSNAFKFTLEGSITVMVELASDGKAVVVRVRDTGVGIPASELPYLFERFHRVQGQQSRSIEGSGIGLALVHELVKLHGGEVHCQSTLGLGTTFSVILPLGRAHLPAEHVQDEAGSQPVAMRALEYADEALRWMSDNAASDNAGADAMSLVSELERPGPDLAVPSKARKRVLLADDNADMRDYIRRLLAGRWEVETVADGEAALQTMRERMPDLVLTDVMMPRLDGFGLLDAIRRDEALREVPVVVISARAGEEARVDGLEGGADDYLTKPFSARELIARVGSNLELARIRNEAKLAIQQRTRQFESLLNQAPLGVYLIDEDFRLKEINPAARPVFGDIPNLIGRDFSEVLHILWPKAHADEVVGLFRRTLQTGEPFYTPEQAEVRRDTGVTEYYEWLVSRLPLPNGGYGVVCYFRDVSEQVLARQAIARSEEILRNINTDLERRVAEEITRRGKAEDALRQAQKMEAVGQLTGGVAHDFNNLLTVIIGGLETIQRSKPEDEARRSRALDLAFKGAQRAASLTSRLLAFSRRQPLEPKPLDLNVLVRDMTELLHRTLGEQIELEGVLAPRLWRIEADKNQLESAIINLAVNARDAMPGGGKLTIETANTALDESYAAIDAEVIPGQYVVVAVSDSGAGMSKETLGRAFEPFFTTKEVGRGTGLGLSMIYGFVKQSGGHISIYSEVNEGTTVKLYFPRSLDPALDTVVEDVKAVPGGSDEEVVLVVEDNDEVRAYSVMVLSELGYRVVEAAEAEQALAILGSSQRVDLLFTDVVLPGKSGRVIADEAQVLRPGLKVLFTTGYSRNAIVHHGRLDAGVQLISKPFTFEQLATRVRDVLDR